MLLYIMNGKILILYGNNKLYAVDSNKVMAFHQFIIRQKNREQKSWWFTHKFSKIQ